MIVSLRIFASLGLNELTRCSITFSTYGYSSKAEPTFSYINKILLNSPKCIFVRIIQGNNLDMSMRICLEPHMLWCQYFDVLIYESRIHIKFALQLRPFVTSLQVSMPIMSCILSCSPCTLISINIANILRVQKLVSLLDMHIRWLDKG